MRWLHGIERRLGHLAFPGLIRIIVAFNALVYLLMVKSPEFAQVLDLQPQKVYEGEVWRLVTYIFIPQVQPGGQLNLLWAFFYLSFLWMIGEGLEQAWGSFKLNCFYVVGMIGTAVAAMLLGLPDTRGIFLNISVLFAFATLFPDYPILLFFVLPVRIKWIAIATAAWVIMLAFGETFSVQVAVAVSLVNYLVFFGPVWVRQMREQGQIAKRQQEFQVAAHIEEDETLHHCKVCGRTELSASDLEFRVASDGEEYCLAHLPSRQSQTPPPLPT